MVSLVIINEIVQGEGELQDRKNLAILYEHVKSEVARCLYYLKVLTLTSIPLVRCIGIMVFLFVQLDGGIVSLCKIWIFL
jgi:hypothetical protein